jgi:uncharacterized iron-regulated membrane protein
VLLLAVTGLVMLAEEPIERWQLGALLTSTPGGRPTSHQARLDAARAAFTNATLVRYQPGRDGTEATRVTVTIGDRPHTVFVDASTAHVRGIVDDGHRIGVAAKLVHGTLLMGAWGDRLIEIAASLGILLIVSGVYLWFPKGTPFWQSFRLTGGTRRLAWRDVHKTTGVILAPVLAYYFISGLAWTDVWGGQFVQAWSTLSAAQAPPGDSTVHTHDALNAGSSKVVPWNLEQTPLPSSSAQTGYGRITLDAAIAVAQREGIGQRFWVGVPSGVGGVWTIAQTGMNKDITDPTQELTVHVDQHTGAVVGRGGWNEYSPMARAMAAGIPLHMGLLGWWNLVAASLVCLSVIALSVSGLVMWWLRRPARGWRLAAPPRPELARVPLVTWATAAMLGVVFPLAGVTLVTVAVLDWMLIRRVPALRHLLG